MWNDRKLEIDTLYHNRNYLDCLPKCFKLLRDVEQYDNKNFDMYFFCYYHISSIYSTLNNFEQSIRYAKKAKLHVTSLLYRAYLNWTFSYCYYKLNVGGAIKYIDYAIRDFGDINAMTELHTVRVHKSLLENDEQGMLDAIKNLETIGINTNRLDQVYADLLTLYCNIKQYIKAQKVLYKIENREYRNELQNQMYQQCCC